MDLYFQKDIGDWKVESDAVLQLLEVCVDDNNIGWKDMQEPVEQGRKI